MQKVHASVVERQKKKFCYLSLSIGKEDTLITLLSAWDRSHDSTAKRNLSNDMQRTILSFLFCFSKKKSQVQKIIRSKSQPLFLNCKNGFNWLHCFLSLTSLVSKTSYKDLYEALSHFFCFLEGPWFESWLRPLFLVIFGHYISSLQQQS